MRAREWLLGLAVVGLGLALGWGAGPTTTTAPTLPTSPAGRYALDSERTQVVELLTSPRDEERSGRVAGVMAYERGLVRFVYEVLAMLPERRAGLLTWGLQGRGREIVAVAFGETEEQRVRGAHAAGAAPSAEAAWVLSRLVQDRSRVVRLAAMEEIADNGEEMSTQDTLAALWKPAIENRYRSYSTMSEEEIAPVKFRGGVLPMENNESYYNQGDDGKLATEALLELQPALLAPKVREQIRRLARDRWGESNYFSDPDRRLQRLVERCEPAEVAEDLYKAATVDKPTGVNNGSSGNRKYYWSNRTWAMAMLVRVTGQAEDDYGLVMTNQNMGGHGWAFDSERDETKAVKKLKGWWEKNKERVLTSAATQASATQASASQPGTQRGATTATSPATLPEAPRYVRSGRLGAEGRVQAIRRGLAQMASGDFAARQDGQEQLRAAVRDRLEDWLEAGEYRNKASLLTALDMEVALTRWVTYVVRHEAEERPALLKWGMQEATMAALLQVNSAHHDVKAQRAERVEGVKALAKDPSAEASELLTVLLEDPARPVYVAAMEAVYDRVPTQRMVDHLWRRAVEKAADGRYGMQQVMLTFRGRQVDNYVSPSDARLGADSATATEVLKHWRSDRVVVKLMAALKAHTKWQGEDNIGQLLWSSDEQPTSKNFQGLLLAYRPAGAVEAIAGALQDEARNGSEQEVQATQNGGGRTIRAWTSERTQMLVVGGKLLDMTPGQLGMTRFKSYQGQGYYFPTREGENAAVKLFKAVVRSGLKGDAATQAAATQGYVLPDRSTATQPAEKNPDPFGVVFPNPPARIRPGRGAAF